MRRLTLRKDTLTELATGELALVAGGQPDTSAVPTWERCPFTIPYPPTLPVVVCAKQ
ncbi:MAG TPA: hypothetical protein VFQ85_13625 [Mycobacteriales bacterium]|jgi:hypothetical protein|nr:hypothetical protein [Mycobacteriales bacterium]